MCRHITLVTARGILRTYSRRFYIISARWSPSHPNTTNSGNASPPVRHRPRIRLLANWRAIPRHWTDEAYRFWEEGVHPTWCTLCCTCLSVGSVTNNHYCPQGGWWGNNGFFARLIENIDPEKNSIAREITGTFVLYVFVFHSWIWRTTVIVRMDVKWWGSLYRKIYYQFQSLVL